MSLKMSSPVFSLAIYIQKGEFKIKKSQNKILRDFQIATICLKFKKKSIDSYKIFMWVEKNIGWHFKKITFIFNL
jgi:hypothetical protein